MLDPPKMTAEWPVRGEGGAPAKEGLNHTGALATVRELSAFTEETAIFAAESGSVCGTSDEESVDRVSKRKRSLKLLSAPHPSPPPKTYMRP